MKQFIIKWFSPIVYASFLILTALAIIIFTAVIDYLFSYLFDSNGYLFDSNGWVEVLLGIVTLGSLIFWFANKVLTKLERIAFPIVGDHYRQSAVFYVMALRIFIILYANGGYYGGLGDGVLVVTLLIEVWAIIINAIYIFWLSRTSGATCSYPVLPVDVGNYACNQEAKPRFVKIGLAIFVGPALLCALLGVGYYVTTNQAEIEYLRMNSPPRVASPNDPPPPADLQSLSGKMPSSTIIIDVSRLPSPSPD